MRRKNERERERERRGEERGRLVLTHKPRLKRNGHSSQK